MDPREYELMYKVEDEHWWYRGMASVTRALLNRWYRSQTRLDILDAGCGAGSAMSTFLADYGQVTGIDIHPLALGYCRKRGLTRIARASALSLPFASAQFDVVTSFDVLYEKAVENDLAALIEFARVLLPGGRVFLRLPAYDWLRGRHDEMVHTKKRYTTKQAAQLLAESGLVVEHISFANMFLFPIAVLKRWGEKLFSTEGGRSDLNLNAGIFNTLFEKILTSEATLIAGTSLPFGLSVVAVGRKRRAA
ncbi:MAG TPA: class I SAM-dependent methyltransferase [Anaerolineales bacterium]|nr:class I SAM-dependent methyltransferase [Anaerolineales bacterium]HQX17010.1 class I SAM-dependent methyltransferase [Anaerolineales bacterium]